MSPDLFARLAVEAPLVLVIVLLMSSLRDLGKVLRGVESKLAVLLDMGKRGPAPKLKGFDIGDGRFEMTLDYLQDYDPPEESAEGLDPPDVLPGEFEWGLDEGFASGAGDTH